MDKKCVATQADSKTLSEDIKKNSMSNYFGFPAIFFGVISMPEEAALFMLIKLTLFHLTQFIIYE